MTILNYQAVYLELRSPQAAEGQLSVITLELSPEFDILSKLFQPEAGSQSGNNGSRGCFTFLTYQWCQFMNSSINLWRYKPSVKNKKTTTFMHLVTHKRSEYVLFRQFPWIPVSRITDSVSCLWVLNNDSKAEFPDSCTKTQINKWLPSRLFLLLCLLKGQVTPYLNMLVAEQE